MNPQGPWLQLLWMILSQQMSAPADEEEGREPSDTLTAVPPRTSERIEALSARLDKTVFVMQAMWTLVAERSGLTEEDLVRRVTEIDARDGTVDGQLRRPPIKCSCGATVCQKFGRCLFCGKEYPMGAFRI